MSSRYSITAKVGEPVFQILFQQEPLTTKPWRLIEVYNTSDGVRSRICEGGWKSSKEVEKDIERRRAERNK